MTKKLFSLFTLAAQQGHSDAQYNLGVCYRNGYGVVKDDKEAVRLYTLAAQQGHSDAQINLGVCYRNGYGVVKDDKEAVSSLHSCCSTRSLWCTAQSGMVLSTWLWSC